MEQAKGQSPEIVSTSSSRMLACRLTRGQDLKNEILSLVKVHNISAGVILSSVGSLKSANLRLAGENLNTYLQGPFEIVSLNGTLGSGGAHLHIGLSDSKGIMFGGHLVDGCIVNTTCELVLMTMPELSFQRTLDAQTGFRELSLSQMSRK